MVVLKKNGGLRQTFLALLTSFCLVLTLSACMEDAPIAAKSKPKKARVKKVSTLPSLPSLATNNKGLEEISGNKGSVFTPKMLRNPFKPFIKIEKKKSKKKGRSSVATFVARTPLQRYAVEELKLVGIIWAGNRNSEALIEDPTGKGYAIKAGTFVGDRGGKIIKIAASHIVIDESSVDVLGEVNKKQIIIKLHKPEKEVNP
jgi:type IV pilus assembly protein PilP